MVLIIFRLDLQWHSTYIPINVMETFIHLCQPDQAKSCGACCGLYNYADSTKASLARRLRTRSALFQKMVSGPEDIRAFSEAVRSGEDGTKRYEVIHCCEYTGFLDVQQRRVGCLLHPLRHGGVDMREVSFYGKSLCEGHLCPSYHYISRQEKLALIEIIDDWYLWGLCITDIDLVVTWFRLVSEALGEMPPPERFGLKPLRDIAATFFSFKIDWPFRSEAVNRFGKYYFDGSQYMISFIDYETLGCERSSFDRIFLSLCSEFKNRQELRRGEAMIEENIETFRRVYREMF
jgi:hypothetical protein